MNEVVIVSCQEMPIPPDDEFILKDLTVQINSERYSLLEERLRILVRPAPRWFPNQLWLRLAARFLDIESRVVKP